jgi:hypothetical protein
VKPLWSFSKYLSLSYGAHIHFEAVDIQVSDFARFPQRGLFARPSFRIVLDLIVTDQASLCSPD